MTRRLTARPVRTVALSLALALVACLVLAPAAGGQYFGKNKVQPETYDWRIYHSPHFDVYHYTEDEEVLRKAVSFAESAYDELSRFFDYQIQEPTPLIIYETHSAFRLTNIILSGVPEGAQAFASPIKFRMVLPVDSPDPELMALIQHELAHIFQYHVIFGGRLGGLRGQPPTWFIEGMASYLADDETPNDRKYMVDAVVNDRLPSVEVRQGGFFAYRFGNAVFRFIEERWGRDGVQDFIYEFRNTFGSRVGRAVERTFRMDVEEFDAEFRRWARAQYLPELLESGEPSDFGRPLRLGRGEVGHQMSPAAAPSGDLIAAFTTDRGELDISLFDANTRRRIRNLTKGIDTSIQGIVVRTNRQIGGDLAFSPDGNTLAAFGNRNYGRSLLLFDVLKGGLREIVDMDDVEQQRSPAFSPDGRYVAFAANQGGVNDIYLLDLETYELANVTNDVVFDSSPVFSPDGRWLTYTSVIGEHQQIFRLDIQNPAERFQLTRGEANNKEPAYSPDARRLYFTSDRGGSDDIYSFDLESGKVLKYTNSITGADRPTVLRRPDGTEDLVYSGFWRGFFGIYQTPVDEPIGEPVTDDIPSEPAAMADLPRFEPDIEVTIDEANEEGYGGFKFFVENANTQLGVDSNQILIGRVVISLSDYLGDQRVIASLSAVDTLSDFDALYLNQKRRWQWGGRLFDTRFYAFTNRDELILNPFAAVERDEIYSLTGLEGLTIYPFDFNNRVEFRLGGYYRDYSGFLNERDVDGNLVNVIAPRTDEYVQLSSAFVSDNTVFNQWGPATGHRVRVSGAYAPDFDESGTLAQTFTLDARQYIPITRRSNLAFRFFGYDSDGNAPNAIFIGGLDSLRAFDTNSLGGFRAAYANAEYRFPLIDQLRFPGISFQGIRGVVFFDIGTAYFPDITDFDFYQDGALDDAFAVYGAGFSVNLFGLPVQWDFAKRTNLDSTLDDGFETNFWIGTRF